MYFFSAAAIYAGAGCCNRAADVTLFSLTPFGWVAVFVHVSHSFTYLLSVIIIYQRSLCGSTFSVANRNEKQRFKIKVYWTLRAVAFCVPLCLFIYGWTLTTWCVYRMYAEVISFNLCNQCGHIIIITVIYPTFSSDGSFDVLTSPNGD